MNANTSINTRTAKQTEILLVLHEQALRPPELEYEYMTGRLIKQLENGRFGTPLTDDGYYRARQIGERLRFAGYTTIYTDKFVTAYETARIIAQYCKGGAATVMIDNRIRESRLTYLDRNRYSQLMCSIREGHVNAIVEDWINNHPAEFDDLVSAYVELWNDIIRSHEGQKTVVVVHLEGLLLFPSLLLGLDCRQMTKINVPRGIPLHILLSDEPPLISFDKTTSTPMNTRASA